MAAIFAIFRDAVRNKDGYALASSLRPVAPPDAPDRLLNFYYGTNESKVETDIRYAIIYNSDVQLSKAEGKAWLDIFKSYWKAIGDLLAAQDSAARGLDSNASWAKTYEAWREVALMLFRAYNANTGNFEAWTIPCLYMTGSYLRRFAIMADEQAERQNSSVTLSAGFQDDAVGALNKHEKLEDAARQINRMFSLCLSDRAPLAESRKWGLYYIANLLFKTYFKLNSISLSKNILKSLHAAAGDMPPIEAFPKSHQVTFQYYAGVMHFLEEDYSKAEEFLTSAYHSCHRDARKNRELILTYLIPCHLLTTHTLPTPTLLAPYPRLAALFSPLARAIKRGDLFAFDAALAAGEAEFVKRRIYLTLERGRDVALRNLFRKVFLAGGYEPLKEGQTESDRIRRTRIPVEEFAAGVRMAMRKTDPDAAMQNGPPEAEENIDKDEVECLIANMIYKNLMKGYIARERSIVVLSKGGTAFPGTGV